MAGKPMMDKGWVAYVNTNRLLPLAEQGWLCAVCGTTNVQAGRGRRYCKIDATADPNEFLVYIVFSCPDCDVSIAQKLIGEQQGTRV